MSLQLPAGNLPNTAVNHCVRVNLSFTAHRSQHFAFSRSIMGGFGAVCGDFIPSALRLFHSHIMVILRRPGNDLPVRSKICNLLQIDLCCCFLHRKHSPTQQSSGLSLTLQLCLWQCRTLSVSCFSAQRDETVGEGLLAYILKAVPEGEDIRHNGKKIQG